MKNIKFPVKIKGDHSVDLVPLSIQWNIFRMLKNKFYHCYNYIVQKEISNRTLFSGWGFNLNSHWSVLFTQVFPVVIRGPGLAQCRWVQQEDCDQRQHHDPDPRPPLRGQRAGDGGPGAARQVLHWQGEADQTWDTLSPKLQASFMPFMEMEAFSTFHSNFGFYIVNRAKEMAL